MKTLLVNFEIPLQLFFMTQTVQFCMLQIARNLSKNVRETEKKVKHDNNQGCVGRVRMRNNCQFLFVGKESWPDSVSDAFLCFGNIPKQE